MAVFIPSIKPEDFNNSYGEKKVYEALRTLSDKYTVFYSFEWVGINESRTIGEADFIILHPEKGILVIEVKSGEIEYKDLQWIQTNTVTRYSKRIYPLEQARKSQFEILDRLRKADLGFKLPMMCYCAWFPSVEMPDQSKLPAAAPKEIVLDIKSLDNPEAALDQCYSYWMSKYSAVVLTNYQFQQVVATLCPYFHVVPKLKTKVEETETSYIQLTNQQTRLLDFLEEQKTAVIHGLAGTGKTVLAVEKAKWLSKQNESVLFLCYNSFLKESLKQNNVIPNVSFHNVHSLAYEVMGETQGSLEDVVSEFADYLEIVFDQHSWVYKNIIVDEGQDIDERLLNRLYELVKQKGGCFYVFYDRNQLILRKEAPRWIENAECRLVLHKNCRNTAEIFKTSCSVMGLSDISFNEVHGETPMGQLYSTTKDLEEITSRFIRRVIAEGLNPEDIVVLTAKTIESSWLSPDKAYGGVPMATSREPGKILFTTIRKFKGLEAKAILIVDVSMASLEKEEYRRLLYVGSSRAMDLLSIAMLQDVDGSEMGQLIRSIAPDRNVPKNIKGLKRILNISI